MKTLYVKAVGGRTSIPGEDNGFTIVALFPKDLYPVVGRSYWVNELLDNKFPAGTHKQAYWNMQEIPLWYIKMHTKDADILFERTEKNDLQLPMHNS